MTRADLVLLGKAAQHVNDVLSENIQAAIAELTILRAGKCATCDKVVPVLREEIEAGRAQCPSTNTGAIRCKIGRSDMYLDGPCSERWAEARAAVDALEGKVEDGRS